MLYFFTSIIIFCLSVFAYSIGMRFLRDAEKIPWKIFLIFAAGFCLNAAIIFWLTTQTPTSQSIWYLPVPLSSMSLYILLVGCYFILSLSSFWKDLSPSIKILFLLKQKKELTHAQILAEFSDRELILKRLDHLCLQKYIHVAKKSYRVSSKGYQLNLFFALYRKIIYGNNQ